MEQARTHVISTCLMPQVTCAHKHDGSSDKNDIINSVSAVRSTADWASVLRAQTHMQWRKPDWKL
jgi:hypothetical protein